MEDFEACSVMGGEAVQGSILGEGRAVKRASERLRFYSSGREVVTKGADGRIAGNLIPLRIIRKKVSVSNEPNASAVEQSNCWTNVFVPNQKAMTIVSGAIPFSSNSELVQVYGNGLTKRHRSGVGLALPDDRSPSPPLFNYIHTR
ncbi:unnamed protein product [Vicia faba]|uniref:Uncharacterized protein n=1 Tax=Vicia faba TaxID=3906 RepID=A0AAV1AF46_VICFA|nr:unnamed protein product [Vicia faba]